jgi:hypothetical protein
MGELEIDSGWLRPTVMVKFDSALPVAQTRSRSMLERAPYHLQLVSLPHLFPYLYHTKVQLPPPITAPAPDVPAEKSQWPTPPSKSTP